MCPTVVLTSGFPASLSMHPSFQLEAPMGVFVEEMLPAGKLVAV
jgi:hypothetical protein